MTATAVIEPTVFQTSAHRLPGTKHYPLDQLQIDGGEHGYQRDLSGPFVERIARNFDPILFGVLSIADRDGSFYLVDGQHRAAALRRMGYEDILVPCVLVRLGSREHEAEHFTTFNVERKRPQAFDIYKADRVAHQEDVLAIEAVLRAVKLKAVATSSTHARGVRSVGTIREINRWHGADMLERVLRVSLAAWPFDAIHGRGGVTLDGLVAFIATHAARGVVVDDASLIKVCSVTPAAQFAGQGPSAGIPAYKAMAANLQEPYNRAARKLAKVELLTPRMYSKRPRRPAGEKAA